MKEREVGREEGRQAMKEHDSLIPVFSEEQCFAPETDGGLVYKNASLHQKSSYRFETVKQHSSESPLIICKIYLYCLFTGTLKGKFPRS